MSKQTVSLKHSGLKLAHTKSRTVLLISYYYLGSKSKSVDFFLLAPPKLLIFSAAAMVYSSRLKFLLSLLCRSNTMLRSNLYLCYEFWMRALWIFVGRYGSAMPFLGLYYMPPTIDASTDIKQAKHFFIAVVI